MASKNALPSTAQAKRLASLWADNRTVAVGGYVDPTIKVLVARGWIVPTGKTGQYSNGREYVEHVLSSDGFDALAAALQAIAAQEEE